MSVVAPGRLLNYHGEQFLLLAPTVGASMCVRSLTNGQLQVFGTAELDAAVESAPLDARKHNCLLMAESDDWAVAQERFEIIRPLLDLRFRRLIRAAVVERGRAFGLHPATLYGWMDLYVCGGDICALLPKTRKDKGVSKLAPDVERVVQEVISSRDLTTGQRPVTTTVREVQSRCHQLGLPAPHANTILNRLRAPDTSVQVANRLARMAAEQLVNPVRGPAPGAGDSLPTARNNASPPPAWTPPDFDLTGFEEVEVVVE